MRRALADPVVRAGLALVTTALLARAGFAGVFGQRLGGDSHYYLGQAERLLRDGPGATTGIDLVSAPLYPMFLAFMASVSGLDLLRAALVGQVVVGALTSLLLFLITYRMSGSLTTASLAGLIGAFQPSFLFWGAYVLSETLFLFALALSADRLTLLPRSRHILRDALIAGLTLLVTLLARPTALAIALIVPFYLLIALRGRRLIRAAAGIVAVGIVAALGLFAVLGMAIFDLGSSVAAYAWSAVYFGLQWSEQGRGTSGVDLVGNPPAGDFRAGVLDWLAADPMHFILQAMRKLRAFWTPVLPEFSLRHALGAALYYVPFYALALNGLRGRPWPPEIPLLFLGVVSLTVTSMITFVDYDQRVRLPAELLLIPLVATGATSAVSYLRKRRSSAGDGSTSPKPGTRAQRP